MKLRRSSPGKPERRHARFARQLALRLERLLSAAGALDGQRIVHVRAAPSAYGSTHRLEELDARLDDGTVIRLILKGYGAAAAASGRRTRPSFVFDPYREVWAYEQLLPRLALDTPRFFGTLGTGGRSGRLVTERVEGDELWKRDELDAWGAAADWLARLHAAGRVVAPDLQGSGNLLVQDAHLFQRWPLRAATLARQRGRGPDAARLEELSHAFDQAVEILEREDRTVIHGEFYPSNIFVHETSLEPRVRVVDWETAGVGPAALDLAALWLSAWDDTSRRKILSRYESAMDPVPADALIAARLVLSFQWLGWAADWDPPAEHRHDWLGEAIAAAALLDDGQAPVRISLLSE